ncbi:UDP-N-acetylglucosamine 2-epimerase (non-hydrolyzing) [Saccharopolyspora sp. ID03-671]|uniref:non-hydrolyzing UDP-N-acetylglucosamine 2-epimerase n=1 Tax=Saccharopolyspora sp. ID03-671 TaxID=3073066 RepID=UPI0032490558
MRIAVVVGTRPESIKLAPVVHTLGPEAFTIHTGQHHTAGMTGHIHPDFTLSPHRDAPRGQQLGSMTAELDRVFRRYRPAAVIVQGDTTSALAGGLAANATDTPLVHVEAGLRSFDRTMPEEHNRILLDHLSDLACAPTPQAHTNLRAENIPPDRITITGNTIVEAIQNALPGARRGEILRAELGLPTGPFTLATLHRPENTDNPTALAIILSELSAIDIPVVIPLHPRTQRRIIHSGLDTPRPNLRMTGPLEYPDLLALIHQSALVISDSGGIQEESAVLKSPILIIRRSNERPEVEDTFGTRLHQDGPISSTANTWIYHRTHINARLAELPSPYGDGTASTQIAQATKALLMSYGKSQDSRTRVTPARNPASVAAAQHDQRRNPRADQPLP